MTLQDIAGGGAGPRPTASIKDTTTADLHEGRDRGIEAPAGAGRFLGAVVRALQAAHARSSRRSSTAAKGKVKLVKMNIDKHPAIPGQMGIQSIPAVIAFVNGQPVDGFMGALPEGQVNAFIERITKDKLGGEAQDLLEGRRRRARRGRRRRARPSSMPQLLQRRAGQRPGARRPRARLRRDRRARAGQADARAGAARPSATMPPSRPRAPRSSSPSRRSRLGPVGELEAEGRRRPARPSGALRSRGRAQRAPASARRRSIICSRSSSATASGTRTARASSSSSSSRPGARPTRRPSAGGASCRRSCSREAYRSRSKAGRGRHADERGLSRAGRPAARRSRCFRCPARCCCRAARCRSTSSSRAISR